MAGNAPELETRLERDGKPDVKVLLLLRNPNGSVEGVGTMFNYDLNQVQLRDTHRSFLGTVFFKILKENPASSVVLVGKADRKNRSGSDAVNQRVSDQRAQLAAAFLKKLFHDSKLDATRRIAVRGDSDQQAVRLGDADQSENRFQRAVTVNILPRLLT
jgi:outer membrane protein OmpA-like peptidoglycan-associated protein